MRLKLQSAKRWSFCLGLNTLRADVSDTRWDTEWKMHNKWYYYLILTVHIYFIIILLDTIIHVNRNPDRNFPRLLRSQMLSFVPITKPPHWTRNHHWIFIMEEMLSVSANRMFSKTGLWRSISKFVWCWWFVETILVLISGRDGDMAWIIGLLWGESIANLWIALTKDQ